MSLLHLAWASAVTFGERVELLPESWSAKLSLGQRTVTHGQLYITAKTVLHASISFPSCLFFPPFSSHLPPSSSPPVPHPLRSSVKFLTFVTKTRDCECAWVGYVRWRPMPYTCGVLNPAGPPISPTSHPVAALKWGPSAECPCFCLPNPHKDLSLCHKFI